MQRPSRIESLAGIGAAKNRPFRSRLGSAIEIELVIPVGFKHAQIERCTPAFARQRIKVHPVAIEGRRLHIPGSVFEGVHEVVQLPHNCPGNGDQGENQIAHYRIVNRGPRAEIDTAPRSVDGVVVNVGDLQGIVVSPQNHGRIGIGPVDKDIVVQRDAAGCLE